MMESIRGSGGTEYDRHFEDGGRKSSTADEECHESPMQARTGEDATTNGNASTRASEDGEFSMKHSSREDSSHDPMDVQLSLLEDSFRFYHPWQPSSLRDYDYDYDEEYHQHDAGDASDRNKLQGKKNNVLVVRDLPPNLDDDGLRDWFSLFGHVKSATVSSKGGYGTVAFEEGSDGAERAVEARPVKIFGKAVEIRLEDDRRRRSRPRRIRNGAAGPFPIAVAPPDFGPLVHLATGPTRGNARVGARSNVAGKSSQNNNNNNNSNKSIFDKATQTLASAATKLIAVQGGHRQTQHSDDPRNNRRQGSAPASISDSPPPRKASLHSLLSSGHGAGDPLFDDDEHYASGDDGASSPPRIVMDYRNDTIRGSCDRSERAGGRGNRGGGAATAGETKKRHFHSDGALASWVWAPGRGSPSRGRAESELGLALARGRAVNAELPLLATTSSVARTLNENGMALSGLDDTNLNLLHRAMDVTVKKAKSQKHVLAGDRNATAPRSGDENTDESENGAAAETAPCSRDGSYTLYQARHPSLAPLVSATRCVAAPDTEDEDGSDDEITVEAVTSIFDITPSLHRSLHELLRTDDFLAKPLFPGAKGHEFEPVAHRDHRSPRAGDGSTGADGAPLPWFRGGDGTRNDDDGFCTCRRSSEQREDDWGAANGHPEAMHRDIGATRSTSDPNVRADEGEDKNSTAAAATVPAEETADGVPPSVNVFGDLQKLREGGAAIFAARRGALADGRRPGHPPPNFLRRRRPWKMFEAGSSLRADVADLRIRFLALQLFHAVNFCHSKGVTLGQQLSPDRIFVQEDGWARLALPITQWKPGSDTAVPSKRKITLSNNIIKATTNVPTIIEEESNPKRKWRSIFRINNDGSQNFDKIMGEGGDRGVAILPYPGFGDAPTVQWQRGQLTNLCYLVMLNAAAGRAMGDLANPPILPWVTDFSSEIDAATDTGKLGTPDGCWRDLSKSKFRLKKGDEQLDQTFAHASPPHHIPETISDLTYTVYRARCLPIDHLRSNVRKDFVSAHYPGSVRALYGWTPDEATIEFFMPSAPCIFRSMHDEMDDLDLPPWCGNSPESFIAYHRRLLESDYVSHRLHSWIDLNFGEALTGKRAISEKNVVLSALPWANGGCQDQCKGSCHSVFAGVPVDEKDWMTPSRMFVQIFSGPHPKKHSDLRKALTEDVIGMRKTVSSALRTVFHQGDMEAADAISEGECAPLPCHDEATDFQLRKQRDISTIGAILKDCYLSARVIPPPVVATAIDELLNGTLDLRQSLKDRPGDGRVTENSFPFPQQLNGAYQFLSNAQSLTFRRRPSDADFVDDNVSTTRSTDLEQVWRLLQSTRTCLESLPSTWALTSVLHSCQQLGLAGE